MRKLSLCDSLYDNGTKHTNQETLSYIMMLLLSITIGFDCTFTVNSLLTPN